MFPEQIPVGAYTHLNYGFASIDPTSFSIAPADPGDVALYSRLTGLKALNPGLEVSLLLRYLLKANLGFMAHAEKRFGFRSVAGQCESSPSLLVFVFAQALLDLTH
jgi:GH18 family chitinase